MTFDEPLLLEKISDKSVVSKYKYDKNRLLSDPISFIEFISKKVVYGLFVETTLRDLFTLFALFVISLGSLIFLDRLKEYPSDKAIIASHIFFILLIVIDSFFIKGSSLIFDVLILLYYLFFMYHLNFSYKYEIYDAIFLLIMITLFSLIRYYWEFLYNLADWVFYLLAIGIFRALIDNNVKKI